MADRHNLDYCKFFFGQDGGYSLKKLKRVLRDEKRDRDDCFSFVDTDQDLNEYLEDLIFDVMEQNEANKAAKAAQQAEGKTEEKQDGDEAKEEDPR